MARDGNTSTLADAVRAATSCWRFVEAMVIVGLVVLADVAGPGVTGAILAPLTHAADLSHSTVREYVARRRRALNLTTKPDPDHIR
jgi:hypothetical protein